MGQRSIGFQRIVNDVLHAFGIHRLTDHQTSGTFAGRLGRKILAVKAFAL